MSQPITGKSIWITGAGSGIGRSLALALAAADNRVAISGRDEGKLAEVAGHYPDRIVVVPCDVTKDEAMAAVGATLGESFDSFDVCILAAGHCEYIENAQLDIALFRRVFDVNLFGLVNSASVALPLLRQSAHKGQLVVVGSLSAVLPLPRAEAYGASKAAMNYLADSLRLDLKAAGVDVCVANPGFVKTPMTDANDFPMPFLMDADEAAQRIINGIARRKRRINFPRRFYWMLASLAAVPALWYGGIGQKFSRSQS